MLLFFFLSNTKQRLSWAAFEAEAFCIHLSFFCSFSFCRLLLPHCTPNHACLIGSLNRELALLRITESRCSCFRDTETMAQGTSFLPLFIRLWRIRARIYTLSIYAHTGVCAHQPNAILTTRAKPGLCGHYCAWIACDFSSFLDWVV